MDYLNDLEQEKIVMFCNDVTMREAVKKVLLAAIYENGVLRPGIKPEPTKNAALSLVFAADEKISNERLGEDLRAFASGVQSIEMGFKRLKEFELPEVSEEKKKENPAV